MKKDVPYLIKGTSLFLRALQNLMGMDFFAIPIDFWIA